MHIQTYVLNGTCSYAHYEVPNQVSSKSVKNCGFETTLKFLRISEAIKNTLI